MATDALTPSITRPSTTMVSTMQDDLVFALHREWFQLSLPFSVEKWKKMQIYFKFSKDKFSMTMVNKYMGKLMWVLSFQTYMNISMGLC